MRLIAIAGMCGAGKTEFANICERNGYQVLRFGDITDEILEKRGLHKTEENEKAVREQLRKEHGMAAYAEVNADKIENLLSTGPIAIDGLYSMEEYEHLREKFPQLVLLAVYAPPETRYERLNVRETRPLTREEAIARDKREIEKLNKATPIAMAHYTVLNVGTLKDLEDQFDKFQEWIHEQEEADGQA